MRVVMLAFLGSVVLPATLAAASLFGNSQASSAPGPAPQFRLKSVLGGTALESGVATFGGPSSAVTDLSINIQQLAPGLYWVVLIRKSDGTAVTLAPLSVFDTSESEPDRRASDDPKVRPNGYQVQVLQTQALIRLPAPFDSTDVAQLLIQNINGVTVLAGTPERP